MSASAGRAGYRTAVSSPGKRSLSTSISAIEAKTAVLPDREQASSVTFLAMILFSVRRTSEPAYLSSSAASTIVLAPASFQMTRTAFLKETSQMVWCNTVRMSKLHLLDMQVRRMATALQDKAGDIYSHRQLNRLMQHVFGYRKVRLSNASRGLLILLCGRSGLRRFAQCTSSEAAVAR